MATGLSEHLKVTIVGEFETPVVFDELGDEMEAGSSVGPVNQLFGLGGVGAEVTWVRCDSDTSEIQPI